VHVAAVAGKAITNRFYGRRSRAYFAGCSDGGREGLIETEQYPADFDGVIAGDPALGPVIPAFNWNQEHLTANSESYIPPDKLALVDAAVMSSCDAADGVADGLIQDPRKCKFDPAVLQCKSGDGADCLTTKQVATAKRLYQDSRNSKGQLIFPGYAYGGESGYSVMRGVTASTSAQTGR